MMKSISILLLASFLVPIFAGKFSLPITKMDKDLRIIPSPNQYEGIQKPLNSDPKPSSHAPITDPNSPSRGSPIEVSLPLVLHII
jgi:hypothetical protein